jgi:hypothetical protein
MTKREKKNSKYLRETMKDKNHDIGIWEVSSQLGRKMKSNGIILCLTTALT